MVHAVVSSHLDYCNVLLFGLPKYQLDRLPKAQNAAARVILHLSKCDHITPAFVDLHWLPIEFRVQFKLLLLIVYKSLHNQAPDYINDLLSMKTESNCSSFGGRAFTHAAPVLWNSLLKKDRRLFFLKWLFFKICELLVYIWYIFYCKALLNIDL